MVDGRIVADLMERLGGLDYYPRDNQMAQRDLRDAIRAAATDAIALSIVNDWIQYESKSPKPAELRRLILEENEKREREQDAPIERSAHCPTCRDTGIKESIRTDNIRSVASYCSCPAGKDRQYSDCSEGKCLLHDKALPVSSLTANCCGAPWRVNAARYRLREFGARLQHFANPSQQRRKPQRFEAINQIIGGADGDDYHGEY